MSSGTAEQPEKPEMLPGERCGICLNSLERITDTSWMCVPCRKNIYWFDELPTTRHSASGGYLQREWE